MKQRVRAGGPAKDIEIQGKGRRIMTDGTGSGGESENRIEVSKQTYGHLF